MYPEAGFVVASATVTGPVCGVVVPPEHDCPVTGLKPEVEVQPTGSVPGVEGPVLVQAARDFAPKIPSATKPLLA